MEVLHTFFLNAEGKERMLFESLTREVIDTAMKIHTKLGAGLFEEVYKVCLRQELVRRGMKALAAVDLPVTYEDIKFDNGYRLDLLVDGNLIVELKAVERIAPIHKAQLLTYLKLTEIQVGLIINFNVPHLRDGIQRVINSRQFGVIS